MRSSIAKYALLTTFLLTLLVSGTVHAAPLPQDADYATLRVVNESKETVCSIYIFPFTLNEWGNDWLEADGTIPLWSPLFAATTATPGATSFNCICNGRGTRC